MPGAGRCLGKGVRNTLLDLKFMPIPDGMLILKYVKKKWKKIICIYSFFFKASCVLQIILPPSYRFLINNCQMKKKKIPHTGDKESLEQCG